MFVLAPPPFRLPLLGSYLQTAASAGDTRSILLGVFTMIAVIVLLDQFVWRPVIAWADKFKFESVEGAAPRSFALTLLRRSEFVAKVYRSAIEPVEERLMSAFASRMRLRGEHSAAKGLMKKWIVRAVGVVV